MKPSELKKAAAAVLAEQGVQFDKLSARTVSFMDLARVQTVFIKVHAPSLDAPGNVGALYDKLRAAKASLRGSGIILEF